MVSNILNNFVADKNLNHYNCLSITHSIDCPMKRIAFLFCMLVLSVALYAQQEVTKFMGIPVDGTKSEMIAKLKAKGFTWYPAKDCLTGLFNGRDVTLYIYVNGNKVWRVAVLYADEMDNINTINTYNHLLSLFENNGKYYSQRDNQEIEEGTDLHYEIEINKKQIQNTFYQRSQKMNQDAVADMEKRRVWVTIIPQKYSYDKFGMILFYENGYNEANGEDL